MFDMTLHDIESYAETGLIRELDFRTEEARKHNWSPEYLDDVRFIQERLVWLRNDMKRLRGGK